MRNFRTLHVHRRADELLDSVYPVIHRLPESERFGLALQMQRAALSTGSNIAEGAGRRSDAEFERFLDIAAGSVSELQYQLTVARRLSPAASAIADTAEQLADEVKAMLFVLMRTSRRRRS